MAISGGGRGRSARSDGAATKARLVSAAVDALRENGFAGASAREIARRADAQQSQVFYYFGSVPDLLLAALDDVSARRMTAYEGLLAAAQEPADFVDAAGAVIAADLASGDVAVLAEMLSGARSVPGLAEQVAARLVAWEEFAQRAVAKAVQGHPLAAFLPVTDIAHAIVASILGLELLASIDPDPDRVPALLDRAGAAAALAHTMTSGRQP